MLSDERYKQLMVDVGLPNSRSLLQALKQCAMEAALSERAVLAKAMPIPNQEPKWVADLRHEILTHSSVNTTFNLTRDELSYLICAPFTNPVPAQNKCENLAFRATRHSTVPIA